MMLPSGAQMPPDSYILDEFREAWNAAHDRQPSLSALVHWRFE